MAKITLDVNEKDLKTVLNILENLKDGLIKNISTNKQYNQVKPISSSINNNKSSNTGKRYLSPEEFKNRLKGK